MRIIDKIILHCSANQAGCKFGAREIRAYHIAPPPNGRGWIDIGYHYVIKYDGTLEEGRNVEVAGAHVAGQNSHSIGICLVGGIDKQGRPENNFTEEQFNTLEALLLKLLKIYPNAEIYGHNDFANKACPVFSVKEFCERNSVLKEACNAKC